MIRLIARYRNRRQSARFCSSWVRSYGEIQKTNGAAQISVLVVLRNRARETVRKFAAELGLTPASRSRVSVRTEGAKDDPAHKYIG
jgi:phage terminase small subunit